MSGVILTNTLVEVYVFAIETMVASDPDEISVLLVSIFATESNVVVPIQVAIPLKLYESVVRS